MPGRAISPIHPVVSLPAHTPSPLMTRRLTQAECQGHREQGGACQADAGDGGAAAQHVNVRCCRHERPMSVAGDGVRVELCAAVFTRSYHLHPPAGSLPTCWLASGGCRQMRPRSADGCCAVLCFRSVCSVSRDGTVRGVRLSCLKYGSESGRRGVGDLFGKPWRYLTPPNATHSLTSALGSARFCLMRLLQLSETTPQHLLLH